MSSSGIRYMGFVGEWFLWGGGSSFEYFHIPFFDNIRKTNFWG
jgi:hypothetical protein